MLSKPSWSHNVRRPVDGSVRMSIVIITRDRADQLLSLMYALRAQTHVNLDVLVVHDGPCDFYDVHCRFPDDGRFRFAATEEATGLWGYPIRSKYESKTIGNWIGSLCDDDWVAPTYVEWLLHAAISNDADVAYCDHVRHYEDWRPCQADFRRCHMGIGGWIGRRDVVLANPTPAPYHNESDGERVDKMVAAGVKAVRVPHTLTVYG